MTKYLIYDGTQDLIKIPEGAEVLILKEPLLRSLSKLKPFEEYELLLPEESPINSEEHQLMRQGLRDYLNEITYLRGCWMNSILNYEALHDSVNVTFIAEDRPEEKEIAIVAGNGFSLDSFFKNYKWGKLAEIFTCWHAYSRILQQGVRPDYVIHLDWQVPKGIPKEADYRNVSFIATPSAAQPFWQLGKEQGRNTYHYFNECDVDGQTYNSMYRKDFHPDVYGTVSEMSLNCAILAGYKTIVMIGVDLLDYPAQPHEESPYAQFKPDIEKIVKDNPDVTFYNAGEGGIYIDGADSICTEPFMKGDIVRTEDYPKYSKEKNEKNLILPKHYEGKKG